MFRGADPGKRCRTQIGLTVPGPARILLGSELRITCFDGREYSGAGHGRAPQAICLTNEGPLVKLLAPKLPMSFTNLVGIDEDLPVTHHSEYAHVFYLSMVL